MIYTPSMRDGKTVFVFGSNVLGRHGAGAALTAWKHWGAKRGCGEGRTGDAYAIPTKGADMQPLSQRQIQQGVNWFRYYAYNRPDVRFLLTKIGCGLAGYEEWEIEPMFHGCTMNVILPEGWKR